MIIKEHSPKKKFSFNIFFKFYFAISILLIVSFLAIFFNTGMWINNKNDILNRAYKNGLNNYLHIVDITYKGFKSFFYDYEEMNIDLSYENLIILENNRKEIIDSSTNGMRSTNQEFNEVEGFITYGDKKVPVKIRLKGDRISHFEEKDKSSYKIKILGDEKIKSIRKFSFIKPRARNYIHEWLLHELAGEFGLSKLKYEFTNLKINGDSQGLYVFEEGFDKDLLERNQRRNGPVFSINEEYSTDIFKTKLELYNKNFWNRNENIKLSNYARNKLQGFLKKKFDLKDTFDLEKWASLFAVADLTYTHHGLNPQNVKFYYNPISGLFEPIAYDGHRFLRNYNKNLINFSHRNTYEIASVCLDKEICEQPQNYNSKWLYQFFYDEDDNLNLNFYSEYVEAIKKITNEEFLSTFFEKRKKNINKINSAIYSDYFLVDNVTYAKYGPGLYYFDKEDILFRAKVLKKKIKPKLDKIFVTETSDYITIENSDISSNISLIVDGLICEKFGNNWRKNFTYKIASKEYLRNRIEIKKDNLNFSNSRCVYVKFKDKFDNEVFLKKINYELPILFSEKEIKKKYLNYFYLKNSVLYLKNKETTIDEDIIIPGNLVVRIRSGENIKILNNAFIISNSRWEVGDGNGKVLISGTKDNFGGGLVIKQAKQISKFYNTDFKYLSGVENRFLSNERSEKTSFILTKYFENKKNSYIYSEIASLDHNYEFSDKLSYTGAINFYETKVQFQNCKFMIIDSEDALNIISSQFLIEDSIFEENSSDSIDIDFGEGIIKNSKFTLVGNDAIDLSGSKAYLENLFFFNVGDKLISSGENTEVNIKKIDGKKSYIGIASKDGSITIAENINFIDVKIPFSSYQKKKSFEHGILKINDPIYLENYVVENIKDRKSYIYINKKKIENFNLQALNIVYKKKLSLINEH